MYSEETDLKKAFEGSSGGVIGIPHSSPYHIDENLREKKQLLENQLHDQHAPYEDDTAIRHSLGNTTYHSTSHIHDEETERICRCCHGILTANDDFIAPCKCAGSMKYVHRYCLDQWRAVSPKASSFYACDICGHQYEIKDVDEHGNVVTGASGYKPSSIIKFGTLIAIDFSIILIVWQVLVFICVGIFALCDYDYALRAKLFGNMNVFVASYICGLTLFFFILGLIGLCCLGFVLLNKLVNGTFFGNCCIADDFYAYDNYPYYGRYRTSYYDFSDMCFWFCFWNSLYGRPDRSCFGGCYGCSMGSGDCNCNGGSDCGGGGNGDGMAIALLVIVVVIAVIGVFFGLILMGVLGYRIFTRRLRVLQRKEIAKFQQIQNYWKIEA
ncbi:hypothetical protein C9374_009667 [Naegleria lovaniensis]|uniref:RING-CH-type domain-containing protein n=1 Tax=Naegleria lovaniensis TaxID=51637 RepID=A0AA88H1K3_NAELO|nr:uncharacterized protein C9374_009667 [Naegleria lovaniensis]KAG2393090.1 hypothetical protein C9374_009667 [Naegleria lovaniensis]